MYPGRRPLPSPCCIGDWNSRLVRAACRGHSPGDWCGVRVRQGVSFGLPGGVRFGMTGRSMKQPLPWKRIGIWLAGWTAVATLTAAEAPRLVWHFAGTRNLPNDTNGVLARKAFATEATRKLLRQVQEKLATAPERLAGEWLRDRSVDVAGRLRPMLEDAVQAASYGLWIRTDLPGGEWALGVQADEATAHRWAASWAALSRAFGESGPVRMDIEGTPVQVSRWPDLERATAFGRLPGWVGVAVGRDPGELLRRLVESARELAGEDDGAWFQARGNPALLWDQTWLPDGEVRLTVRGRGERLLTEATIQLRRPLEVQLDPWDIPTNIIREPLIGFTAVRGIRPLLERIPLLQNRVFHPLPNQLFLWSLGLHYTQNYLAWRTPDALEKLRLMTPVLAEEFRRRWPFLAPAGVAFQPERKRIVVTNLIMSLPFLEADPGGSTNVIAGGLSYPLYLRGKSAPPELFAEVTGKPNLLYYGWELTQPRLEMLWYARTYLSMIGGYYPLPADGAVNGWLRDEAFTACLGNAATELSVQSPTVLKLGRLSAIGLTAPELIRLGVWIDGERFPLRSKLPTIRDRRPPPGKRASSGGSPVPGRK